VRPGICPLGLLAGFEPCTLFYNGFYFSQSGLALISGADAPFGDIISFDKCYPETRFRVFLIRQKFFTFKADSLTPLMLLSLLHKQVEISIKMSSFYSAHEAIRNANHSFWKGPFALFWTMKSRRTPPSHRPVIYFYRSLRYIHRNRHKINSPIFRLFSCWSCGCIWKLFSSILLLIITPSLLGYAPYILCLRALQGSFRASHSGRPD